VDVEQLSGRHAHCNIAEVIETGRLGNHCGITFNVDPADGGIDSIAREELDASGGDNADADAHGDRSVSTNRAQRKISAEQARGLGFGGRLAVQAELGPLLIRQ
jgi:hypothetical protein